MGERFDSEREYTFSRDFSVRQPTRQDAFVMPERDWIRIRRVVNDVVPARDVYQLLASTFVGVFLTAASVLVAFWSASPSPPAWAWTTVICTTVCSFLLAAALFAFHFQQRADTVRSVGSVLSELDGIHKDLVPPQLIEAASDARPAGTAGLQVVCALYGADGGKWIDVTAILNSRISDGSIRVPATNQVFGSDPVPYVKKKLVVIYTRGGGLHLDTVAEDDVFSISG